MNISMSIDQNIEGYVTLLIKKQIGLILVKHCRMDDKSWWCRKYMVPMTFRNQTVSMQLILSPNRLKSLSKIILSLQNIYKDRFIRFFNRNIIEQNN